MGRFTRSLMVAALATGVLGGAAAVQKAEAQHVVTEGEASKLTFDALTAVPASHYVQPAQYYRYRHRHFPPPRRHFFVRRHRRYYR